jgi:hypothetical protein
VSDCDLLSPSVYLRAKEDADARVKVTRSRLWEVPDIETQESYRYLDSWTGRKPGLKVRL